jgi:arylsulfatase A-like enzyme
LRANSCSILVRLAAAALGSILLAACDGASSGPQAERRSRPNVLLVLVDTLRADHLHSYGYHRNTSDTVDALAYQGWLFERHIASASQTVPSTLSMMLSVHPAEHGFRHLGPGHFQRNRPLYPESFLFLAEVFSAAGYATAGFVGNPFLQKGNGFAQGFDEFVYSERSGDTLTDPCIRWLDAHAGSGSPFFAYLHYFDVHWPYDPPVEFRRRFPPPPNGSAVYANGRVEGVPPENLAASIALYDGAIAWVDHQIARLLDTLDRLGVRDDTIVVVTSDHGEEFLEHGGLGHGTTVYGELVRVPLVIVYPRTLAPGRRIDYLTRHLDLPTTLLELASIEKPGRFRGRSLRQRADAAFTEDGAWIAVYSQGKKLVVDRESGLRQLFSDVDVLDRHPLEAGNVAAPLVRLLDGYSTLTPLPRQDASREGEWSQREFERLRSLGYVN